MRSEPGANRMYKQGSIVSPREGADNSISQTDVRRLGVLRNVDREARGTHKRPQYMEKTY